MSISARDWQSVLQSVLSWAVNRTLPNLSSWQLTPTTVNQTARLWKAQPIHLDGSFSKGSWPPLDALRSKLLRALLHWRLSKTYYSLESVREVLIMFPGLIWSESKDFMICGFGGSVNGENFPQTNANRIGESMKWGWQEGWQRGYGSDFLSGEYALPNNLADSELFSWGRFSRRHLLPR